jgi:hypothetical protein
MEGFPVDMTEDDVSPIHSRLLNKWSLEYVLTIVGKLDRRRASERVPN